MKKLLTFLALCAFCTPAPAAPETLSGATLASPVITGTADFTGATVLGLTGSGRVLCVDAVNGNDTRGARGDSARPFLTLGAALAAATSGDTICVRPGTYNEGGLLKDGVNWYFQPGARVIYTGEEHIFSDYLSGVRATSRITGSGYFQASGTGNDAGVLHIAEDSDIYLEAIYCGSTGAADQSHTIIVRQDAAGARVVIHSSIIENTTGDGSCTWWGNGDLFVEADEIRESGSGGNPAAACVYSASTDGGATGDFFVRAKRIRHTATSGSAVLSANTITAGSYNLSKVWVDSELIESTHTGCYAINVLDGRIYVTAEKIFGPVKNRTSFSSSGALLYVTAQKIEGHNNELLLDLSAGTSRLRLGEVLDTNITSGTLGTISGGTAIIENSDLQMSATGVSALSLTGGSLTLRSSRINAASASGGYPLVKSGGTLVVDRCILLSNGARDSINAATAQNVVSYASFANNAKNANVTLQVGTLTVDANTQ